MSDHQQLEQSVQEIITEICDTLQRYGFETVSLGAVMRLLGIDERRARDHDTEMIYLTGNQRMVVRTPQDRTLH